MTTEGQTAMTESNEVGSSGSSNESYEKKTKVEGTPDSTMPPNYHNFIIYEIQRNIHSYTTSQLLELRYKLVTRHIDCLDAIRECIAIHGKESVKIGAVQNIDGLSLKQLLDNGIDGMNIPKIKYVAHCLEDSIRAVVMDDFDRSPVV
uniref:SAM domain-containing protein n=1 Tax=Rhabditophanes sp. KR3021 TaxID=114890 RepID=A0AC35U7M7_9BILA